MVVMVMAVMIMTVVMRVVMTWIAVMDMIAAMDVVDVGGNRRLTVGLCRSRHCSGSRRVVHGSTIRQAASL